MCTYISVANNEKRGMLWELYQLMVKQNENYFGNINDQRGKYLYDCGINFYSLSSLNAVIGQLQRFSIDHVSHTFVQK